MAKWIDTALDAMKVRREKIQRELDELDGHIAEAEAEAKARAEGPTKPGRRPTRRDQIIRALKKLRDATPSEIADFCGDKQKRGSIDQILRVNRNLFEKHGRKGRETKWRLTRNKFTRRA